MTNNAYASGDQIKDIVKYISDNCPTSVDISGKENKFRYQAMPIAGADYVGKTFQYTGETDSNFTKNYFYQCVALDTDPVTYEWQEVDVQSGSNGQTIQLNELPIASAELVGKVYQYIGTTTQDLTHNYFYECKTQGTDSETYAWENVDVQAGGGGDDSRIKPEIKEIGVELSNGFRPYIIVDATKVIPSFDSISLSDLALIANAYYNGDITIEDIKEVWVEGDMMQIDLSAMSATGVSESHSAQTVNLKIVDFGHDNLTNPINGKTKSFLTYAFLLDENGVLAANNATGWDGMARRTWCNETCFDALPAGLKELTKAVDRTNGSGQEGYDTLVTSIDKLFIANYKEFMGDISLSEIVPSSSGYSSVTVVDGTNSTQYELYKTVASRQFGKDVLTATTAKIYHSGVSRYYDNNMLFVLSDGRIKNGDIPSISCGLLIHGNI